MNGISQTTTSLARAIGPALCGFVYSRSLENPHSLVGAPLCWFLLATVALANYSFTLALRQDV